MGRGSNNFNAKYSEDFKTCQILVCKIVTIKAADSSHPTL